MQELRKVKAGALESLNGIDLNQEIMGNHIAPIAR